MTAALILAAGFGTRLRPLTLELPKPAVPVGDRPLIAHVAQACRAGGATRLVANAHHEHEKLLAVISAYGLNIHVTVEAQIRGTAGGVAGARALLGPGSVLVWNGDILTDAPVAALLHTASERDAQVLAVSPRAAGEGTVGLDAAGAVVRLRGQVFGQEASGGDYIGVCALGPSVVAALPDEGCLFADVALPLLARGGRVWSVPSPAPWSDLGDLGQYVAANFEWLAREHGPSASWLAPDVQLPPGVSVERCLLGAGARVSGSGALRRVIAWPGATLQAPLADAVVLASGRVVPLAPSAEN
jgi:mannose-1-phosphate guanylyltransferase